MRVFAAATIAVTALALAAGAANLATPAASADPYYGSPGYGRPVPQDRDPAGRFGHRPPTGYYTYRAPPAPSCPNNTAVGVMIGAGVGGLIGATTTVDENRKPGATIMGALIGAILGGAIGQSADRAQGC